MGKTLHFVQQLERGEAQKLVVYGTSLSFHLAPHLRAALVSRFGEKILVVNAGQSGRASRTGLRLLDEKVLVQQPDAVLMEWAVNDAHSYFHEPDALDKGISLEESRANLERILERIAAELPDCEVVLMTTNPTFDSAGAGGSGQGGTARPLLSLYYQGVRDVASARGLRLIDAAKFWNSLRERDEALFRTLVPDGVHPTPQALREHLVPFLLAQLKLPSYDNINIT